MKTLADYIDPPKRGGAAGNARVIEMFRQIAAKQQGTGNGDG